MSQEKSESKNAETKKISMPFFSKRKIVFKKTFGEESSSGVIVREFEGISCEGTPILEVFASSEKLDVGQMAAFFLIQHLKLPIIGDVTSLMFPTLAVVKEGIPFNSGRIYGNKDLVIFISDFQFGPSSANIMKRIILDFAERHKSSMLVSAKAMDNSSEEGTSDIKSVQGVEGESGKPPQSKEDFLNLLKKAKDHRGTEKLWFITNDESIAKRMISVGNKPMQSALVSGISAGFLANSAVLDIPILFLFTPQTELQKYLEIDSRASLALLHCLNECGILKEKQDLGDFNKMSDDMIDKIGKVIEEVQTPLEKSYSSMWT
jgi:predicted ATP-grasp superfamily ATP-dependent carboligase